jgi:hypothetical protein
MDSDEEIENFYRNWLITNKPKNNINVINEDQTEPPRIENIIFQNDLFELYVEKGIQF